MSVWIQALASVRSGVPDRYYEALSLTRSYGGIVPPPAGQHTAFQLDVVVESPCPEQADRGYQEC